MQTQTAVTTLFLLLLVGQRYAVNGYSTGVPPEHCWDMEPRHGYNLMYQKEETSPYFIVVTDAQSPGDRVRVGNGEEVNLKLLTKDPDSRGFKGFLLIAEVGVDIDRRRVGNFRFDTTLAKAACNDMSGLTHTSAEEKMEINVTWTSPAYPFEGDVTLWATFVQTWQNYWVEMVGDSIIEVRTIDSDYDDVATTSADMIGIENPAEYQQTNKAASLYVKSRSIQGFFLALGAVVALLLKVT